MIQHINYLYLSFANAKNTKQSNNSYTGDFFSLAIYQMFPLPQEHTLHVILPFKCAKEYIMELFSHCLSQGSLLTALLTSIPCDEEVIKVTLVTKITEESRLSSFFLVRNYATFFFFPCSKLCMNQGKKRDLDFVSLQFAVENNSATLNLFLFLLAIIILSSNQMNYAMTFCSVRAPNKNHCVFKTSVSIRANVLRGDTLWLTVAQDDSILSETAKQTLWFWTWMKFSSFIQIIVYPDFVDGRVILTSKLRRTCASFEQRYSMSLSKEIRSHTFSSLALANSLAWSSGVTPKASLA